jgi:PAS domain S-box-containing protein
MEHGAQPPRRFGQRPDGPTEHERLERFNLVLDGMPCAVLVIGELGNILMVNIRADQLFGYEPDELVGQPIDVLVREAGRSRHQELRSDFLASRDVRRTTDVIRLRRKDGSLFPGQMTVTKMPREHETAVVAAIEDLTDRVRLDADAAFLAAVVVSSTDAIIGQDLEGCVRSWNASAQRMYGYTSDEMVGRPMSILIPPDRQAEEADILEPVGRGERIEQFETVRRAKDGRDIAVSLTISPVYDLKGVIVGASKIVRDISQAKAAADRLRKSEARLNAIFAATGDGIAIISGGTGLVTDANDAMTRLFGYPTEEIVGNSIRKFSADEAPYDEKGAQARLSEVWRDGASTQFDWLCKARDGRLFLAEVQVRSVTFDDGFVFLLVVRDVDETRAIQRALLQSQKMEAIGQLTSGVAHDFNNLLAVIHGNLELIGEAVTGDATLVEMVADALDASERGASLTSQLLAFSRKQALAPRPIQADEAVADVVRLIKRTFSESFRIRLSAPPGSWALSLDPHLFQSALLNLALNARDAMADGGSLTFDVSNRLIDDTYALQNGMVAAGRYVQIAVSDTGTGIPRDLLDKVIEPFFTTKPQGKGTGLGLSMVYGFVKQSGGNLKIYSEPGAGTTITLLLPTVDPKGAPPAHATVTPAPSGETGETVLVLEDDDTLRKLMVRLLSELGYHVRKAADGPEALRNLDEDGPVDLLLSDVILTNGMNGAEVARTARERGLVRKTLFMSGYAPQAAIDIGRLDEDAQLLRKPFSKSELAAKVREMLD